MLMGTVSVLWKSRFGNTLCAREIASDQESLRGYSASLSMSQMPCYRRKCQLSLMGLVWRDGYCTLVELRGFDYTKKQGIEDEIQYL